MLVMRARPRILPHVYRDSSNRLLDSDRQRVDVRVFEHELRVSLRRNSDHGPANVDSRCHVRRQ